MPNCFSLTPKGEPEPVRLGAVDDAMRAHFGAPPNPDEWYRGWYQTIGFMLARGLPWEGIREHVRTSMRPEADRAKDVAVVDWLEANYTADAWTEAK
jgi:hypothetical protein